MKVDDQRVKFYLKLFMSIIAFVFFIYYTHIEVSTPASVDRIIFVFLIAVMGALLGIDILGGSPGGRQPPPQQ